MPTPEVTLYVRNQSSRGGVRPKLIVLHTTEGHDRPGVEDLRSLGAFFDNPNVQASSHVANDRDGNDARYVADERKAWTQAYFNPAALSIEQIGFAAFTRDEWLHHRSAQLKNTAEWIAYWAKKHRIPLRHSTVHGVCQHSDLGAAGGGHHDCGDGYPFGHVLNMARKINATVPNEKALRRSLRILRSKAKAKGWKKPWRVQARKLKRLLGI